MQIEDENLAKVVQEEYREFLARQTPMLPRIVQDEEGVWSVCGRCGWKLWKWTKEDGKDAVELKKWCPYCGQMIKYGRG